MAYKHKRSATAGSIPAAGVLQVGEIAVNFADKSIYTNIGGSVVELARDIFKSAGAPATPVAGDVWFDTVNNTVSYYDGATSSWKVLGTGTVKTVNGIGPDAAGNVAVALTAVSTGLSGAYPATPNEGDIFVVSGEADPTLNGKTYIYDAGTTSWLEISGADTVANDARYVNVAGDTMTGILTLSGDPTLPLEATTKQYVDAKIANSEVVISTMAFDGSNVTITETGGGNVFTVDIATGLDARYVNVTGDTITGDLIVNGNTTIDGTLIANNTTLVLAKLADVNDTAATADQVLTWDAVNSEWVAKTPVAGGVNAASFDALTGLVSLENVGGVIKTVDIDGRYLELIAGGTVTGNTIFNGNLQTPTVPTVNTDVTNKLYVDALVANTEVSINAFSIDVSGNLVIQETNGNTHALDLFAGLDPRYVNVSGDVMTGNLTVTGLLANGTIGTAGQVLYTDGALAYWANNDGGNKNTYDAVAPATFIQGDIWYDTSTGAQNIYWGGVWNDMLDGGSY